MGEISIRHATLNWNEQGTPVSREFDDVYFSNQDGPEETKYVFLTGNQIPERFSTHSKSHFVIAETGFGTGLNFITLWDAFRRFKTANPQSALKRLHFISFEKYPLTREDLTTVQQTWPQFAELCAELRQIWPLATAGCHRLYLDNEQVMLDLWFGDVNQLLPTLDYSIHAKVDAWFLDGFAPSKNPDMWTPLLFNHMAKLAADNGTFATFTAAGFVRRGLQDAGFKVSRIKGFGHKREMLVGIKDADTIVKQPHPAPWYARPPADNPQDVAIIGGGIASAMTALSLLRRGAKVTLYCADAAPAQSASGNHQGVLYPLMVKDNSPLTQFFTQAFTFARQTYDSLLNKDIDFDHQWCGVIQLGHNLKNKRRNDAILASKPLPQIVTGFSQPEAETACGLPVGCDGIHYPMGGWLSPLQLTTNALAYAETLGMKTYYQSQLIKLERMEQSWSLSFKHGKTVQHATVILAMGYQVSDITQAANLPLTLVRGQVSQVPTSPELSSLQQVLCYDGYLTPVDQQRQFHCLGASHGRDDGQTDYRQTEQEENRQRLINCLPNLAWPQHVDISDNIARCSIRSAVRDHFPLLGALPDYSRLLEVYQHLEHRVKKHEGIEQAPIWPDLYLIAGLGSRGLCSAPLLAEILAGQIFDEPLPMTADLLEALSPNRKWIKKLLKGAPL
ncbi:tRNA 5-methylaminomethyl-2-thiouridine biosynthesis bifunctional protein MnmC [Pragia fontium]|uniref:bifunctional tRNA (5-methylaminomethyl-2-thiouridine)(34)-methyltransferase MnmD/FAD-dependent 5-carboxymethylaminomethyl-2-thiouridine(34) oxidoreductase MnmC n=1 Tax=Pragia fontium TaxID=82985 RepID=UPI000E02B5FB|nr:bifunctional tRNA (5-methylaminomethyl-2-thiouridine)(34)-methyltransferase MnmD/FAD-dependent 5-carboxymethylaminomethyl-2-thiouridine(34) oxidoreductase MnmC [Pragia fontium]SUB81907.1 tRNA 5-methylaminomethyl-2-thiouridine biosynthesis bifunctional protein MnmC [Pragia fontium]